ncbi:hypothetical protein IGI04_021386 [Brassica rapa subsp. trilocularis]|uniref:AAA+ ATPase domain-containing protein n=1 Tax=Brassica rapa subsp. trilocularis TaxID=1813537 RepID=A0ABQ7M0D0_BRACM|nr:hypothetical protein IGI04_021386 [Brassica rapa subsp. trilocularis]
MGGCVSVDIPCDQVVSQTYRCLFGDGNHIHMMKANLEALDTATRELRERRFDLSRRVSLEEDKGLERLAKVEGWLSRAESIDSEVSHLLREEPSETKRLCLFGYCSKNCISSCKYGKKVSKKLEEVKELLSKGVFEELAEKRPASKVVKKDIQTTIGLDSMVGKAWDSIMKPEGRTLGIYGMGGVGKTTLLARINNKFNEEVNEFDVVIWVVVSKDLQYKGIQDQILRRLRADQELEKETEEKKASFIENILRRKKFILLLDDLWSAVDLNKIGVPRPTQENGSKIVFTTRKKEVCRHMRADDELKIDCLSTNEAWELFQNVVGEAPLKKDSEILTLAKKISEKCHGLPLALNVIGKAMSCKEDVHEWRHANDVLKSSSREFPGMEENILSVLKFSYDGLEDDKMKSCFMYCSLFPEDYEIKKEELIEYWINEGFINGKRDEDGSNNKGHVIIGSLVRAHLLMESETTVKMHDVLREMALWIGSTSEKEEEKQCVKSGVKLRLIPDDINWSVSRRISLMSNQIEKISCCPKCPNLSTLFLRDNDLKGIPGKFFQFMPSLVVLDLSRNRSLRDLPEEICSLTSLQYLNLSYTRISSLSVGLKGLRKLISLDLEFTKLKSIDGIGTSLPNLQVKCDRFFNLSGKYPKSGGIANEAWELFRSIVGEDTLKLHQDIPALAKQICEKCYGLPLALNVIGKAMSCKKDVHEWRHANKVLKTSSHEFPGMEEKILSVLKFSYDGLETEKMKSCFLYCSLFPEDYEIEKEELIEYWISEGFIKGERDEDGSNNEGYDIIGSLVRAHLLMECDTKSFFQFGFIPAVKMHDVLREMALWIGKEEEKQCVKSGGKLCRIPEDINWSVLRRISLMSNQIEEISCCPECPNLSTLFLRDNKLEEGIPGKFFQFMPALVVLDLSRNRTLRELPEEICSLISLQYLNLSRTCISSLPVCLKGLRKLISLDLEFSRLKSIDGIGTSLPNLQVLKLYFSSVFIDARSIEVLQLLEHLKILTGNVKDALMLESIQRVERLASCVQCLWISEMSAEVLTLNTVALDGLRKLDIESSKISEIKIDWKSKEKEDLLCNSSPYFKHLSRIAIFGLEGPKELSWLLFAPNLKHLEVSISGSIEELINKEKGMSFRNVHPEMTVPFPKLESLDLSYLPGLKRICSSPPALPHLKNIIVKDCPNLPKAAMKFPRHE